MKILKYSIMLFVVLSLMITTSCKKDNSSKVEEYTVRVIYGNGYEDAELKVEKGKTVSNLNYYEEEHKKVIGFVDDNNVSFDVNKQIDSNLTINAVWEYEKHIYTFYDNDRKTILLQKEDIYGAMIEYPDEPETKKFTGYSLVFKQWSDNLTELTEDVNIYAQYKRVNDQFTVTFKGYDGEDYSEVKVDYGNYIDGEPDPSDETSTDEMYYHFDGWFNAETDELFDFNKQILSDVVLYPKHSKGPYIETKLEDATISILGDSISTFYNSSSKVNSYYPGNNQYYYPVYSSTVVTVEKTWWYQAINGVGAKLGINNSLSGSAAYGNSTQSGQSYTRLRTLNLKGTANIVFVFLGTNDNVNSHTVEQVESAYRIIIEYIQENCIAERDGSFIKPYIYLFQAGYSAYTGYGYTEERRVLFNNMFAKLANEYNRVRLFNIGNVINQSNYKSYLGDSLHYNADGMLAVSTALISQLKNDFNTSKEKLLKIEYNVNKYYDEKKRRF